MNPRVAKVEYLQNHKLLLTFSNGERKIFNLMPYLNFPVYHSLQDESFCSHVSVFNGTVKWDETIDFDPDTLYLDSMPIAKVEFIS